MQALLRAASGAQRQLQRALSHAASAARLAAVAPNDSISGGLFGLGRLWQPADFPRWAREAQERCDELVQQVLDAPPDATAVRLVDDISDAICQVYDSAECCRNIHADPAWQHAAGEACQLLSGYLADINHHEGLYNKLLAVERAYDSSIAATQGGGSSGGGQQPLLSQQQLAAFCGETRVAAAKYRRDFEKFGIHLAQPAQRSEAAHLLALNQHFPARFNAALSDPSQLGSVDVPAKLLPGNRGGLFASRGAVAVPLDTGSVAHFLQTVEDESARQRVYLAGGAAPAANLGLLDDMLAARHQLARLLGFESFAAFKASDSSLAGTPAAAESFLVDLADGCRQQADRELALLTQLKRQHTHDADAVLQPWDLDFFSRQLSSQQPHVKAAAAAAPYLQLSSVLDGLSQLLQQLMGVRLQQQPLAPGEAWAPGVLRYQLQCSKLGPLGVLYLDVLPRQAKLATSGILYPLRCGRELPGGSYQQPVLCLVCNLGSGGSGSSNPERILLGWREFRTLLHEMGHAVHSMVSRTRYQHVWGTRCSQDIVEVPSHLWEHFTSNAKSLALLARHRGTRDPLPARIAHELCKGCGQVNSVTPALELQQQTLLSLVDLAYHGPALPARGGGTSAVWSQLAAQHSSLPPAPGTRPQLRFSHLTIYGASYFAYLYARCISEAIWTTHLAADPLNPAAGEAIRRLLLEPGGAKEPLDLLTAVLGGESSRNEVVLARAGGWCPSPTALLKSIGGAAL